MAGGATIDHIIAVTVLLTAMLLAMMTFNGLFAQALEYDRNRQVANKAVDLINTICLSSGRPENWGETSAIVTNFGLQDPQASGYTLSPYSLMRLTTGSGGGQLLEYPPGSGNYYNNITANFGDSILTPLGDCLTYDDVTELLGISGEYGFSIEIEPTLEVSISSVSGYGHLALKVDVTGSGLPLSGATLNHYLLHVTTDGSSTIVPYVGVNTTNPSGSLLLEYDDVDEDDAYHFMTYVKLNGITGMGYRSQDNLGDFPQFIVPLVSDYDDGKVIIAHSWGVHEYTQTPVPAVTFNATFFVLTSDFQLQEFEVENSTGLLNYGSKNFVTTQIPTSEVGMLIISYKWNNRVGSVVLPWGVGTLGVSVPFRSEFGFEGYGFVATELRQVTINGISYLVKVSTWKLGN
ncbi:MAG: hypothetical protein IAX21_08170 [Candidatus Bathyarchaeota archaeon]|nr:MAG: hypothetical protein IAX21_08170 [Candidatus Bathyarchaeota archaeon]